jgi:hypothetical protein
MDKEGAVSQRSLPSLSVLLVVSAAGAAILIRLFLFLFPAAGGSPIPGVHIHHLLIGILLACIGGIPAVLLRSEGLTKAIAVAVFGVGLGLSLDEWVLFVIRETAPDAPYMSPWSVVGAAISVGLLITYTRVVGRLDRNG